MSRQQQQLGEGLDAYLQRVGKDLPVGGKIRLRLVQGPLPVASVDPVEPSTSSSSSSSSSNHHNSIPKQHFPSILKFPPSSTQPPDFTQAPWNTGQGRLHLEPVPKPPDDSDDEEEAADRRNTTLPAAGKKKRWKYNRPVHPNKQWIVQDQVDFLETMVYRRKLVQYQKLLAQYRKQQQQHAAAAGSVAPPPPPPKAPVPPPVRSTRYVGVPERMTGHHVLFTLATPPPLRDPNDDDDDDDTAATIIVRTLPSLEHPIMVPMTQPAVRSHRAFATLSGAAQVMEDQRFAMSTASLAFRKAATANSLFHNNNNNNNHHPDPDTGTTLRVGGIRKINPTQSRLLQKLQQKEKVSQKAAEEDDGDDVMADVAYKERKGGSGGGGAARRELLSTLGDGLKVSDDGGVLGGTNDALFGGRGLKFNRVAVSSVPSSSAGTNGPTERGADGAAMSDDFYTRDVGAEYEEMDYDAAEQFDDDDVDVGETEMTNVGNDGYNEDEDDEDNDDASEDMNDDNDDAIGGAEGLASMAGYKALLAKARGEIQAGTTTEKGDDSRSSSPTGNANNNNNSGTSGAATLSNTTTTTTATSTNNGDDHTKRSVSPKPDKNKNSDDHLAKKSAAAEKAAQALKKKESILSNGGGNHGAPAAAPAVDEHGLRLITLDAVRKEIWLNHGSIPINRLIKIFNANKKHGEVRQNQLKEVIKELCTMTNDPIQGRVLVLKQHYSHMS